MDPRLRRDPRRVDGAHLSARLPAVSRARNPSTDIFRAAHTHTHSPLDARRAQHRARRAQRRARPLLRAARPPPPPLRGAPVGARVDPRGRGRRRAQQGQRQAAARRQRHRGARRRGGRRRAARGRPARATAAERRRLRLATCPPAARSSAGQGDAATSLATVALLTGCAGLLAGCPPRRPAPRASPPSPRASAAQRVADKMARYAVCGGVLFVDGRHEEAMREASSVAPPSLYSRQRRAGSHLGRACGTAGA